MTKYFINDGRFSERQATICSGENKLLRYVDDSFIEENEYTTALYDFFVNNMKLGESDAWDTVGDCILEIKNGENPLEEVLSYLDYRKLLPEEKI